MRIIYALADQDFAKTKSIGILNLSVNLLRAAWKQTDLKQIDVLLHPEHEAQFADRPEHVHLHPHSGPRRSKLHRIAWDQHGVVAAARRCGGQPGDWLVLPKGFAPFRGARPFRLATYVHDVMHDYYRRTYPGEFGRFETGYFFRGLLASIRHSELLFTNSAFSAAEIQRVASEQGLTCPPVVPIGIGFSPERDPLFAAEPVPMDERRGIVALASTHRHKRTDLAVEYLNRFQTAHGIPVDWIGSFHPEQLANHPPLGTRLPRLDADAFGRRIAGARALVYMSAYEGFGMPPVEAVLLGTCPVFTDLPPTREVMGQRGHAFQLENYTDFERAVLAALDTPLNELEIWRRELLARFQDDKVAAAFVDALRQVNENK